MKHFENGAINPLTYERRYFRFGFKALSDWRMKATIMWDGQTRCNWLDDTGLLPPAWHCDTFDGAIKARVISIMMTRIWVTSTANGFARNPSGGRTDGAQDFYLMRLADVMLMYCEAKNEIQRVLLRNWSTWSTGSGKEGTYPDWHQTNTDSREIFFRGNRTGTHY